MNNQHETETKKEFFQNRAKDDLELFKLYKNGCEASREKLILRQEYRVKQLAKKHLQWKNGLSYDDLLQQGWVGIIRAVETYNESLNVPFNYYAVQWCNAMMNKGIYNNGRTVRTPISTAVSINKLKTSINEFYGKFGREPSDEELAKEMGIKEKKVKRLKVSDVNIHSVSGNKKTQKSGGGDSINEVEYVLPSNSLTPSEELIKKEYRCDVKQAIDTVLDKSEKQVINEYYGITCEKRKTLEELGPDVDRTKPGVMLMKLRALNKIKNYLEKDNKV